MRGTIDGDDKELLDIEVAGSTSGKYRARRSRIRRREHVTRTRDGHSADRMVLNGGNGASTFCLLELGSVELKNRAAASSK